MKKCDTTSLLKAMKLALNEITGHVAWEPCDEGTGKECKGLKCWRGEHRAAAILEKAIAKTEAL